MRRALLGILFFPWLCFAIKPISFDLETGMRFDTISLSGDIRGLSGTTITTNSGLPLIVDPPLELRNIDRRIKNMNQVYVGGNLQLLLLRAFLLRGHISYGTFINNPKEYFQGSLTDQQNLDLVFRNNANNIMNNLFSIHLEGQAGLMLPDLIDKLNVGFAVGYYHDLLKMNVDNEAKSYGFLGNLIVNYELSSKWFLYFELAGLGYGSIVQKILFSSLLSTDNTSVQLPAGTVRMHPTAGYHGKIGLQWFFGPRWNLKFGYSIQRLYTKKRNRSGFGGQVRLRSLWTTQKLIAALEYTY